MPVVHVVLDEELYGKLSRLAGAMGVSRASVLRILLRAVDFEEHANYVAVVSDSKLFHTRRVRSFITTSELGRLRAAARRARRLKGTIEVLRLRLREAYAENRRLRETLEECWHIVSLHRPASTTEHAFIRALREHGLLTLAKKYHLEGDKTILEYLEGDDTVAALHMYKNQILAARDGEAKERRKMLWIF